MTLRPAPGEQISAGRLRVDAAKAIAKLREYQLVDRTAWVLEAIRAAVAAGATKIDLQGDSNDVWLSWSGTPWPAEDLPKLFDELVSPEPGASRHHVRLLAAAVNSALGANPAYVDVYTISDDKAMRVRFTPDVLEAPEGELEESPLRHVQAEPATIPAGASKGMHVHYRRRASLEVISYWLRRADPPEIEIAKWACENIAVPIRIGETVYSRASNTTGIVRVPLGGDLDGFIAVTDGLAEPTSKDVPISIAERGVLLETSTMDLGLPETRTPTPLRVFIDAPRMPTNASRSEVRRDAHPLNVVATHAKDRFPALVAELVKMLTAENVEHRVWAAAIRLLATQIAGPDWPMRAREIEPPLRELAELPLLRDATGAARAMHWSWSGLVHMGNEPLPKELAPWMSHVLWTPPEQAIFAQFIPHGDAAALKDHIKLAKRERRAETKFYKHAPREPRVVGRRKPRVRARLGAPLANSCIADPVFEGFAGEVCVYRDRDRQGGGELAILLEGREIETVEFDSTLAFSAVIDSARLKPTDRYRGVLRDAEYVRLEYAMRAGIVRAIEAVALAQRNIFVDGYQVATAGDRDADAALARSGILLARNLSAPLSPVFENAAVWRTSDDYRSIAELRAHAVLGVTPLRDTVPRLQGRVIVVADDTDRAVLSNVVNSRFIPYEPSLLNEALEPHELALSVMGSEPHALAIREDDVVGVILPAEKPTLLIHHRGKKLADATYTPTLAPCTIAIDCDQVVPDEDWLYADDDAGLGTRDYSPWERALARAAVTAIVGSRSPDLIGGALVDFSGRLGRWLCQTLIDHANPAAVLGDDLLAELKMRSLFRILGDERRYSIAELALKFPDVIRFVEHAVEPIAGFSVVHTDVIVARMIARLAGRKFHNVAQELSERRAQIARELRLGMHRAKPIHAYTIADRSVKITSTIGKGVVGVSRDAFQVEVLLEGRLFQTISRANDLPLTAVFEIDDIGRADDKLEALRPDVVEQIIAAVRGKAPELVRAIAEVDTWTLADAGPNRTLLVRFVEKHQLPTDVRDVLARTIKFVTVQGQRATVVEARSGATILSSSWRGDWLGPDDHPSHLDGPILQITSNELTAVLRALGNIVDVTRDVEKLQTQRRIARGFLPTPRVSGTDPDLTRSLQSIDLPSVRVLGPGEAALASGPAEVLVHVAGQYRERVAIECWPSIQLAIEAPDLVGDPALVVRRLGPTCRELATALARDVLKTKAADALPVEVRGSIRRAILAGLLTDVPNAAVFETAAGQWIDLAAVQAQRELFGNLWCVPAVPAEATPLDERRIVLVLSGEHMSVASAHGIPVVDATTELALDAKTRKNRARPLAESLEISHEALVRVDLPGDGITSARGVVAVLSPAEATRRRMQLHRAMHPFDETADPCRWPTISVLDDARFTPDRCWSQPERDDVYKEAIDRIHRASNEALRTLATPPANALASTRIAPWTYDTVTALRGTDVQLRGAIWIAGPPLPTVSPVISVVEALGERSFVPLRGPGLAGTIYVYAPHGWKSEAVLEELSKAIHTKLVREMALAGRRDPDLVSAHVAWALALGRLEPGEAKNVKFACFRPAPLDATAFHKLAAGLETITLASPDSRDNSFAFVDDGTETARVIRSWLGSRLRPPGRMRSDTVEPPLPARPIVEHPLQPFVNRLHARIRELGISVPAWRIVDERDTPIAQYSIDHVLELAGNNRHIVALAAAASANTAWVADALDALAAHCVTVLNIALTSVTDAAEAAAISRLLD